MMDLLNLNYSQSCILQTLNQLLGIAFQIDHPKNQTSAPGFIVWNQWQQLNYSIPCLFVILELAQHYSSD